MIRTKFSRRIDLSVIAILVIFLTWTAYIGFAYDPEQTDAFRFVFATDIHLQPEKQAIEGFNQAIYHMNNLNPKPQFVIMGGDLIEDSYVKDLESAKNQYDLLLSSLKKLDRPIYHIIGNNDYVHWNKRSNVKISHPDYGKGMFRRCLGEGKTYSSFDHGGWHFILLDSLGVNKDGRLQGYIDQNQMRWLKGELEKTGEIKPVCIALHIPLLSLFTQLYKGVLAGPSELFLVKNAKNVIELLSAYNVKLVLQGHLHLVEELKYKNTTYITGGSVSGFKWRGPSFGHPEGFVIVDVEGDDFTWEYVSIRQASSVKNKSFGLKHPKVSFLCEAFLPSMTP